MKKVICIDIGSSYIKTAVVDTDTMTIIEKINTQSPEKLDLESGKFELDPEKIYAIVKRNIDAMMEKYSISSVWFDSQMHGFVLSKPSGFLLSNYISWRDTYAQDVLDEVLDIIGKDNVPYMGTRFKAGLAVCSYYKRYKNAVHQDKVLMHSLSGYLIFKLSGYSRESHICSRSIAASMGFYDVRNDSWNTELCKKICGDRVVFPRIIDTYESAGSYKGIGLYGDIGDHQATVYGICNENNIDSTYLTLGTAGIVSCVAREPKFGDFETRPFIDGKYLLTKTRQPGGKDLDNIIHFIADCMSLTGTIPNIGELWTKLFRNYNRNTDNLEISGDYTDSTGSLTNIGYGNLSAYNLFSAALNNMISRLSKTINEVAEISGCFNDIYVCGGKLAHNSVICNQLKKETGKNVVPSEIQDESIIGLAKLSRRI